MWSKCWWVLTRNRMGLFGMSFTISSMTARLRRSSSGASTTAMKSLNSTATLLCDAPPSRIHSVGQLLRLHADRKGCLAHGLRNGNRVGARVRRDVLERAAETVVAGGDALGAEVVIPAIVMMPPGGKPHAVSDIDVALVREFVLVIHVAQDRIGNPCVNPLEQVLLVDRGVHAVLPQHR